jgi:two component transcriptional regulator, LuxR family
MTTQMQDGVHTILQRLRSRGADSQVRIEEAIESYCALWASHHGDIRVDCTIEALGEQVTDALGLTILRMVQESLTNVARHAHATRVEVRLGVRDDEIEVEVIDNGRGLGENPRPDATAWSACASASPSCTGSSNSPARPRADSMCAPACPCRPLRPTTDPPDHPERMTVQSLEGIRVLLADDHATVRMGFRLLLEGAGATVLAELDSGEAAVSAYTQHLPDVLMMDVSMPGIGGLGALERVLAHHPGARVLILSAHDDAQIPARALRAGATGYLSKRAIRRSCCALWPASRVASATSTPRLRRRWRWRSFRVPGPARRAHREGVRGLPAARPGPQRGRDRGQPQAQPEHGRHPPVPHQAEAQCLERRRTGADRHPQRADRGLTPGRTAQAPPWERPWPRIGA